MKTINTNNRFAVYERNEKTDKTKLIATAADWYDARALLQEIAEKATETYSDCRIDNFTKSDFAPRLDVFYQNGDLIYQLDIADALFVANDAYCSLIAADEYNWLSDECKVHVTYIADTECCMYELGASTYINRERAKAAARLEGKDESCIKTLKLPEYSFALKVYNRSKQKYDTYEHRYMEEAQDSLFNSMSEREADQFYDGISYTEINYEMHIEPRLAPVFFSCECLPLLEKIADFCEIKDYYDVHTHEENAVQVSQKLYTSSDRETIHTFKELIKCLREAKENTLADALEESLEYQIWDDETEYDE